MQTSKNFCRQRPLRPGREQSCGVVVAALERRVLLRSNGTLSTIAAFNGANGFSPSAVVEDAHGNIFGATLYAQCRQPVAFRSPQDTGGFNAARK